ncbi:phage major capsid protein [Desulfatitalea alkaliphila]|uniref:Phage major capsid protein n=1 Tax=Desulfatitalea alkaliphila TaxID=2929485 RepID=A0AA41R8Y5_9BACT|nr:phage major capsid protein [Desulfatitalea alkaliphila]MCJ8501023.1 phage major capsid protein [Desulfatitalea alkaliphila]
MRTANGVQSDIEFVESKVETLRKRAAADGRQLTKPEQALMAEYNEAIAKLQNELDHMPQRALTVQLGGGRTTDRTLFNSFGEQLRAIRDAGIPGGPVDNRLHQVVNSASGLNETVPSDGGFLIEKQFAAELLQNVYESGQVAKLCRRIQISGNSNGIKIPGLDETSRATGSRWGGVRSYWVGEAEEKTASKPKFRQIDLELKKSAVLIYATDELLQDSTVLTEAIGRMARDELAFALDDAIINGTGATQPLGILNSGGLVTQAAESQAAGTLVPENIVKMWARLLPASQKSAVWLINQELLPQLYLLTLEGSSGGVAPLYMPAQGLSQAPYGTIFGRPVIPIEQCQAPDTAGDIILGDFSNGYILAEKGGIDAAMSIHVRFVYDESVFRFVMRIDGQPVLSAPISPFKGSNDVGHFVCLAGSRSA